MSCKPISVCLVLLGMPKSEVFTHSARTVKGRWGWKDLSICSFYLFGQFQFPSPAHSPISAVSRPSVSPVFPGVFWDASSAMTVAEGSPGQVEARFAFQALPTY